MIFCHCFELIFNGNSSWTLKTILMCTFVCNINVRMNGMENNWNEKAATKIIIVITMIKLKKKKKKKYPKKILSNEFNKVVQHAKQHYKKKVQNIYIHIWFYLHVWVYIFYINYMWNNKRGIGEWANKTKRKRETQEIYIWTLYVRIYKNNN